MNIIEICFCEWNFYEFCITNWFFTKWIKKCDDKIAHVDNVLNLIFRSCFSNNFEIESFDIHNRIYVHINQICRSKFWFWFWFHVKIKIVDVNANWFFDYECRQFFRCSKILKYDFWIMNMNSFRYFVLQFDCNQKHDVHHVVINSIRLICKMYFFFKSTMRFSFI